MYFNWLEVRWFVLNFKTQNAGIYPWHVFLSVKKFGRTKNSFPLLKMSCGKLSEVVVLFDHHSDRKRAGIFL